MSKNFSPKKILFLTATRADFGKIKSLISILEKNPLEFDVSIAVTGMHLSEKHGNTYREIEKSFPNIKLHIFSNDHEKSGMDIALANTIKGISSVLKKTSPDLFIVHGDRIEALAGAAAGALNNLRVAHIEGGEVSGTIDELMRHATSKMAHLHYVANESARELLEQMGELPSSISVIGSPDLDLMSESHICPIEEVRSRYAISFSEFAICLLHPVTTNLEETKTNVEAVASYIENHESENFVIIGPNNDHGSEIIWSTLEPLSNRKNVRMFPSLRFEYFISLLKNSSYIVGNSSAGVREAPYLGVPCINLGTRQNLRATGNLILDVPKPSALELSNAIEKSQAIPRSREMSFGDGSSDVRFLSDLRTGNYLNIPLQKMFRSKKLEK